MFFSVEKRWREIVKMIGRSEFLRDDKTAQSVGDAKFLINKMHEPRWANQQELHVFEE